MAMCSKYILRVFLFLQILWFGNLGLLAQEVPILNYSVAANGQVQIEVNSTNENYYILKTRLNIDAPFQYATSMKLGAEGTTLLSESLSAFPEEHYQVLAYPIDSPIDTDGDGLDDVFEYNNTPVNGPLNAAPPISEAEGSVVVNSFERFSDLSFMTDEVQWSEFLNGRAFVKFIIVDFNSSSPKTYFIDSNVFDFHSDFADAIGIEGDGVNVKKGQVIYYPNTVSNNGTEGTFAFNYSNGHGDDFDVVQRTHELLAANMTFLDNNFSYFVTSNSEDEYSADLADYESSRIPILFEADVYEGVDYIGLNQAEGFGFFRKVALDEIPSAKDIVLYESIPNSLPRVGGIMTSVIQTPLSHVNLRAIQNGIPNAYVKDPLDIDSVANLLNEYIYYKVERDQFTIRQASIEEVNDWFDDIRPEEEQLPPLNLDYTDILPLSDISFTMFDGFGAKTANVATMGSFGFPTGTIPDGFGVPFYFYQEFMKFNNFFDDVELMLSDPDFVADRDYRDEVLDEFRSTIKSANMPEWMLNELADMHNSFPSGTSVRCRSSTNNEDLPGFSGAGLYTSKTQHPDEGHISKSIKQVFASLWNLRAFEEREFYRVNHFMASMGVLCHPNYTDEKANGVGVSADPIYNNENTFYLNSQIGEELITNPEGAAVPEELLLTRNTADTADYIVIQYSSLNPGNELLMEDHHLVELRDYLGVIHDEFEMLYNAEGNAEFAMDIEYKITNENQLIIKQARPWVAFRPNQGPEIEVDDLTLMIFPNPATEHLNVLCKACNVKSISIFDVLGKQILQQDVIVPNNASIQISINHLHSGIYFLTGFADNKTVYSQKFIKQ